MEYPPIYITCPLPPPLLLSLMLMHENLLPLSLSARALTRLARALLLPRILIHGIKSSSLFIRRSDGGKKSITTSDGEGEAIKILRTKLFFFFHSLIISPALFNRDADFSQARYESAFELCALGSDFHSLVAEHFLFGGVVGVGYCLNKARAIGGKSLGRI